MSFPWNDYVSEQVLLIEHLSDVSSDMDTSWAKSPV